MTSITRWSVAAAAALALAACAGGGGSPGGMSAGSKAEYQRIFTEAIQKSFAARTEGNVCLPPMYWTGGPTGWIEVSQRVLDASAQSPTGQAAQMKALEEAGLIAGAPTQRTVAGRTEAYVRYIRTDKGNAVFFENRFCYARAELDRIVKWRGPAVFGEYQIAWVYFTARTSKVADWAATASFQAAFPTARSTLHDEPQKVRQALIDLTSEGWEVNEWSRVLQ